MHKLCTKLFAAISALVLADIFCPASEAQGQSQNQGQSQTQNQSQGQGQSNGIRRRRRRRTFEGNPNGSAWAPGKDNSQNTNQLKNEMKLQERRERRQYEQSMMQVKEQQQQQYETEMLQKLGSQRPAIKQGNKDVRKVRQQTGANDDN